MFSWFNDNKLVGLVQWLYSLCGCLVDHFVVLRCFPGHLAASSNEVGHLMIGLVVCWSFFWLSYQIRLLVGCLDEVGQYIGSLEDVCWLFL